MPDYAVNTRFTAKDRVTPAFKRMGKSGTSVGTIFKGAFASAAVMRGLGIMFQGVSAITREFIDYDAAITAASAKFKDLNRTSDTYNETMVRLKQTARDLGATTEFTATQAAQGLDFLAMAGFNTEQAMAALPGVVNLATVAQTDLARATDIASDSIGAFGLMTEDAGQLQANFTRLNDVFARTMTTANTNMEDLFESVKKGAPAFTASGQSLESFNTLVGIMANSGVKGSESGTQLRNMMLRLAGPTGEAASLLKEMDIVVEDSQGNFRDIIDILADFEKGTASMGEVQKAAALKTIFGARSITGVNILLQEGSESLREYREKLIGATGASAEMADVIRGSLSNRIATLKSAAIELGFKFFDAFANKAATGLKFVTDLLQKIDPTPLINGIGQISRMIITAFRPLISAIKESGIINVIMSELSAIWQNSILPQLTVLIGAAGDFIKAWVESGGLEMIKTQFIFISRIIQTVANSFTFMFKVARFALGGIMILLGPVLKTLTLVIKGINFLTGKSLGITAGSTTGEGAGITAPNAAVENQRRERDRISKIDQNITLNGPPGTSASVQTSGSAPIDVNLAGNNNNKIEELVQDF